MTRELLTHLSEEALDDVLIGMATAESQAHLARCPECRTRVEQFVSDVELFNTASMAWSEARPRRMPDLAGRNPVVRRMPFALVGSAAAAVLAVVVALSVGHQEGWIPSQKRPAVNVQGSDSQAQDPQAQIAQDNQLMEAVNAAIGPEEESPIDEFGISESPVKHLKAHPK